MSNNFEIWVGTSKELLAKQPPEYAHLKALYTLFGARIGSVVFPSVIWADFAGVWLFQWYEAVWRMSEQKTRAARLPFFHTYEIWLRRTPTNWWKASRVERHVDHCEILGEELVIPEQVEAALITAGYRFLRGALDAGAWTEDCTALEALLHDTRWYLHALDTGGVPVPRFLTSKFKVPLGQR